MTAKRIPAATIRRVWADTSLTVPQAAAVLGVHHGTLARWVKLLDLPLRKRGIRSSIPDGDATFAALWLAGVKGECLSDHYGLHVDSLRQIARRNGLPKRQGGWGVGITLDQYRRMQRGAAA